MHFITSPYKQDGIMTSKQVYRFACTLYENAGVISLSHFFPESNVSAILYENVPSLVGYMNLSSTSSNLIFNRSKTNSQEFVFEIGQDLNFIEVAHMMLSTDLRGAEISTNYSNVTVLYESPRSVIG